MKLRYDVNSAEITGSTKQTTFGMKASGKAFNILSSGIYSNKFNAIVRELACNAYDSHLVAEKADVPFEIHLPSKLEPYFSVKDFGVGLDHDDVFNVFAVYFESTKNQSNLETGALGLGAKSPYSYTSTFTITAVKDGIKRLYGAYVNDEELPTIAQLGNDIETDEGNGVEVKFSVDGEDFVEFYRAAEKMLSWFPTEPVITGADVRIHKGYVSEEFPGGVRLMSSNNPWGIKHAYALMANIIYPINIDNLPSDILDPALTILNQPLIIEFDNGSLDFAPSREELQYTKYTKVAIADRIRDVIAQTKRTICEKYTSLPTISEKLLYLNTIGRDAPGFRSICAEIVNGDAALSESVATARTWPNFSYVPDADAISKATKQKITIEFFAKTSHRTQYGTYQLTDKIREWSMPFANQMMSGGRYAPMCRVYVNDLKSNGKAIMRHHALAHGTDQERNLEPLPQGGMVVFVNAKNATQKQIDLVLKEYLGNPPEEIVLYTSKLPPLPRNLGGTRGSGDYVVFNNGSWDTCSSPFEWLDENPDKTILYVPLSNTTATAFNRRQLRSGDFARLVNFLRECSKIFSVDTRKIYGFRKNVIEQADDPRCINLFDHIKSQIDHINYSDLVSFPQMLHSVIKIHTKNAKTMMEKLPSNSPLVPILSVVQYSDSTPYRRSSRNDTLYNLYNICNITGIDNNFGHLQNVTNEVVNGIQKTVHEQYPMLQHVNLNSSYNEDCVKDAIDYIQLVDVQSKYRIVKISTEEEQQCSLA